MMSKQGEIRIERVEEFEINKAVDLQIRELLIHCFSEYPNGRNYYKQLPDFRYLAWVEDRLIAHLAVEHRMINVSGALARIFGVADICVHEDYQSQRLGTTLLQNLEELGRKSKIDFIVLFADEHSLYLHNGFTQIDSTCRWLMINEHQTLGVGHRTIEKCLMYKAVGDMPWRPGLIDFLGHLF